VIPKISQQMLAESWHTRARVNFFMNRFRKLASSSTTADCTFTVR